MNLPENNVELIEEKEPPESPNKMSIMNVWKHNVE